MSKICLVTEELAGIQGSGGIGAAFSELALFMAAEGNAIDILYCPVDPISEAEQISLTQKFAASGVRLDFLRPDKFVHAPVSYEKKSFAVYQTLKSRKARYDFIHFHDYKGLGFSTISAKGQGLAFSNTCMVVQLHGPTRWAIQANKAFFLHEDQLKIDFMERESIRKADQIVSPSAYLLDWLKENEFKLPEAHRVHVIKNICTDLRRKLSRHSVRGDAANDHVEHINEIVLFARHEDRKGFAVFCDAIDRISEFLSARNVRVTLLGKLGNVSGQNSGIYFIDRARNWSFPISIFTSFDRDKAANYLVSRKDAAVVIPSPVENSPYTVFETIVLHKPLITSSEGGAKELISEECHEFSLCRINKADLADKIESVIRNGAPKPKLAETLEAVESAWRTFHITSAIAPDSATENLDHPQDSPKVVFGITHYERPDKLIDAVTSAIRQTYKNLEIVVVDDGSKSDEALEALDYIEVILSRTGGRLIRRDNGYLGAARNTILKNTESEYIVFLDDDDIAFPALVETLVKAIQNSKADVVNCINVYMEEQSRYRGVADAQNFENKVSYVPLGGPLSIAVSENVMGAATALFRRQSLESVGGYTEIHGVGHEDYELFLRLAQHGANLEICPERLYLYEVGRPSMLNQTSMTQNYNRCFEAIDSSRSVSEWRDLMNLHIGKKVAENSHNRAWWLNSIGSNSALRLKIFDPAVPSQDKVKLLAELAAVEGNSMINNAFLQDFCQMQDRERKADEFVPLLAGTESGAKKTLKPRFDPELASIKVDIALGRRGDAMSNLVELCQKRLTLSSEVFVLLSSLMSEPLRGEELELARHLAAAISECRIKGSERIDVLVALASFYLFLEERVMLAALCAEIVEEDEKAYLNNNIDVKNAIELGELESAIAHFQYCGFEENRTGFLNSQKLANEIGRKIGKELMAWDIKQLIVHEKAQRSSSVKGARESAHSEAIRA